MCRFVLLISNRYIENDEIKNTVFFDDNSLSKQTIMAPYTPGDNNWRNKTFSLDGFGIGFYNDGVPKDYKNTKTLWNDPNLVNTISLIKTKVFVAHVRAVNYYKNIFNCIHNISAPVHHYNCHPFIHEEFIFCHNGCIEAFYHGRERKKIINKIHDDLLVEIRGNTDSEYLFYLIMSYIKRSGSMMSSVKKAIEFIRRVNPKRSLSANIVLTDGKRTVIMRYLNSKKQNPCSLYLYQSDDLVKVSSEPTDKDVEYVPIQPNSIILFEENTIKKQLIL